jgi:hypothetical protein
MACGHDVMLDLPEELTQVLDEIDRPQLRATSPM